MGIERNGERRKREGELGEQGESRKRGKRVDIPGCTPWLSQRIAMATDPETPCGRRTIGALLSDDSNNVSSLSLM